MIKYFVKIVQVDKKKVCDIQHGLEMLPTKFNTFRSQTNQSFIEQVRMNGNRHAADT